MIDSSYSEIPRTKVPYFIRCKGRMMRILPSIEQFDTSVGVRDIKVNSGGATGLPVVFGAAIEMAAAEGDDGVGTADGPEHAGLFEAAANDGLTPGFDNAGTDEKVLTTKLGITHAVGVFLKVIGLLKDFFGDFRRGRTQRTQEPDQLLDLALIEVGLVAQYPFSLMGVISWVKETSQVPEMLAGVK